MKRIKNIIGNATKKATAKYNDMQAKAWGDARFRIMFLSIASYIALC